jgi:hypothetical protein
MLLEVRTNRTGTTLLTAAMLSLALVLSPSASAVTVPLADISTQTIFEHFTGGLQNQFGWWAGYDIGFSSATNTFNIDVRIRLDGDDPGTALMDIWEQGIESIWSNQYQIAHDDTYFYDVAYNVDFVATGMHHVVTVHNGTGNVVNMLNWETLNPGGWPQHKQDEFAAHEFGHMVGNYDEYPTGAVNPDGSFNNVYDSIMGTGLTQTVHARHYQFISDWVSGIQPGETFSVVSMGSPPPAPPPVPLPPAVFLLGSGLAMLAGIGRRKTRQPGIC